MRTGRPRRYPDNAARQRAYRHRQTSRLSLAALMLQLTAPPADAGESWAAFIARVGAALSRVEQQRDTLDWTAAGLIVAADQAARSHPDRPRGRPLQVRRRLLEDLRHWWTTHDRQWEPRPTALTHALRLADQRPDLFADVLPRPEAADQAAD